MKKHVVLILAIAMVLAVALAAVAQQRGGMQGFQQRREAQMKALDTLAQNAGKLKAAMGQMGAGLQGRSFQDLSEDERAKMREEFTKRREEQQKLTAEIEQALMTLRGSRQLWTEYDESVAPLKELLASAQSEKATATAGKIEKLLAQRQKQFEEKLTALGYDPTQRPRSRQQP
jgi:hypothetical protein